MNCDRFKCVVDGRLLSDSDGGEPKMHVLIANPPWPGPGYGARSDVRWPHKRSDKYIEYPIYLSYTVAVVLTPSWTSWASRSLPGRCVT